MTRASLLATFVLLTAAPLAAQPVPAAPAFGAAVATADCPTGVDPARDLDGDCLDDDLEQSGFDENLDACTPGTEGCFVTDPTAWSTDGDPYSDFQEATGVNMEATVENPYRHPLVAAAPQIEVFLTGYQYKPTSEITDSRGQSLGTGFSATFSMESTTSASTTIGAEASATGPKASAEATASQSLTVGFSATASINAELNWETATSTKSNEAAELRLHLRARNTGGGTAKRVRPTLNVYIGGELIVTIRPADPFPSNLTPGDGLSDPVVVDQRTDGNRTEPIYLTFDQLKRLRRGAPVSIRVVGMEAEVERWNSADSNWSCGTASEPCLWESFQDQIEARTLRLSLDYGYSGDPDADIPARYFGNPFDYRIYTGSPAGSAGNTLRDVLGFLGLAEGAGAAFQINGRPFPSAWLAVNGPQTDRQGRQFVDHWETWAGTGDEWPRDLLDMPMPRNAHLALISPDPVDPFPVAGGNLVTGTMRRVLVAVGTKGSIPVVEAEAHLFQHGVKSVVPMERLPGSDVWATPDSLSVPVSVGSSYIVLRDYLGEETTVGPGLTPVFPTTAGASASPCAEIASGIYREPQFGSDARGVVTVFVGGNQDLPATAYCGNNGRDYYWVPQITDLGVFNVWDVEVIDRDRRVAAATETLLTSDDGGQTWRATHTDASAGTVVFWSVAFREGTGVGIAVGDDDTFMRTEDYGETWALVESVEGSANTYFDVDYAGGDTWYAVGGGRIRRSDDNGKNWVVQSLQAVDGEGNPTGRDGFRNLDIVEFISETQGIVADPSMSDDNGRIWATTDGGETWRMVRNFDGIADVEYRGDGKWVGIGTTPGGSRRAWLYDTLLEPGGNRLDADVSGFTGNPVAVSFGTPDVGFLVLDNEQVWRTEDGGETWEPASAFPTNYVLPNGQTYMTRIDMLDANIGAVTGADGRIGATDSGGGFPTYTTGDPVDEEAAPEPLAPGVTLAAPAPNPFRQSTVVRYALDAPGSVRLTVYDALGREVSVLAEGDRGAGEHSVRFEASGLAAGVYVVRLVSAGDAAVQRVTVVR